MQQGNIANSKEKGKCICVFCCCFNSLSCFTFRSIKRNKVTRPLKRQFQNLARLLCHRNHKLASSLRPRLESWEDSIIADLTTFFFSGKIWKWIEALHSQAANKMHLTWWIGNAWLSERWHWFWLWLTLSWGPHVPWDSKTSCSSSNRLWQLG